MDGKWSDARAATFRLLRFPVKESYSQKKRRAGKGRESEWDAEVQYIMPYLKSEDNSLIIMVQVHMILILVFIYLYTYPSMDLLANIGRGGSSNSSQKCGVQKSHRQTILYLEHTHTQIQSRFTIQRVSPSNILGTHTAHSVAQHSTRLLLRCAMMNLNYNTSHTIIWNGEIDCDVCARCASSIFVSIQNPFRSPAHRKCFSVTIRRMRRRRARLFRIVLFVFNVNCVTWHNNAGTLRITHWWYVIKNTLSSRCDLFRMCVLFVPLPARLRCRHNRRYFFRRIMSSTLKQRNTFQNEWKNFFYCFLSRFW